ncbi:MAG: hypothetical protein AB7V16_08775 [Vulcanibacillus sp.]
MKARDFKKHTYTPNEYYDYMTQIENSMSGDMALVVAPATLGSSATAIAAAVAGEEGKYVRTVAIKLVNGAGEVLEWFNGSLTVEVTDVTAGDGASAVAESATTVQFIDGIGTVDIEYTGTWAAEDTQTTTIKGSIMGYTLTNKTSVDTIVA